MAKYTYLLVNFFTILVPFLFSFHPRIRFYKEFPGYWKANFILCAILIPWDMWFINKGIWDFNDNKIIGLRLFRLPLEEGLFFVCVLFSCVFSYFLVKKFMPGLQRFQRAGIVATYIMIAVVVALLIYLPWLWNTCGILVSLLIVLILFVWLRPQNLVWYWVTWLFMVPPFLIVNGILTGAFQKEPVTVYNPDEMLNIFIVTIPIEDVFYGMMMIGLNVLLYELFSNHEKTPLRVPGAPFAGQHGRARAV